MKILLQNKDTLDYVRSAATWTPSAASARVFATSLDALLFCLAHGIFNVQILGCCADPRMNFVVPVTDLRKE